MSDAHHGDHHRDECVLSYHCLRRALGPLGPVLPFILIVGGVLTAGIDVSPLFHYGFALTFFICRGVFCFFKVPKTAKPARRRIYLICGWVIVAATVVIALASYLKINGSGDIKALVVDTNFVFWAEAVGAWAFAFSWQSKGKAPGAGGVRGLRPVRPDQVRARPGWQPG